MTFLKKPIRMCIVCRIRTEQKKLIRLRCSNKKLILFDGNGRSFYICSECIKNEKKLEKSLYRECKNKDAYIMQLKEILVDVR